MTLWMKEIINHIVKETVPPDKSEARKLRMKSVGFCMFGERLYRKSFLVSAPYSNAWV